jgi:hypothetical protein
VGTQLFMLFLAELSSNPKYFFLHPKTLMKLNWPSFWAYFPPKTPITTETKILIPKTES